MKAVWYDAQGPADEVLHYGELPTPQPAPGELRVRLRASAVNPADANRRAGRLHGMDYPRIIPNSDGAGVVDAVGEGVDPGRVGERVWLYFGQRGRPFGTAAEAICLPEELATALPAHVTEEQGACLGIPGLTAYCALFDDAPIAGRTVLVTGGAGAVGHYAVQLAKWGGALVIATVSSKAKAAHARAGGADVVIDYTRADAAAQLRDAAPDGVHRIVDVDAVANAELVLGSAVAGARWVSYAIGAQAALNLPLARLIRANLRLQGLYLSGLPAEARRAAQRGICDWLAQTPQAIHTIDSRFPLHETARAHLAVEAGAKMGTVIVTCDPPVPDH
ncbi:MAG: NADPH:quinone reductase [Rhodoferax sp.]|nr:NADPH:quinone reductase [Rhodoferax sp.]MCB2031718.1 NADPH:quinone reductase [Rhodoferax sp.]MCB2043000.1 NADPH:quinone reductase [Rhodoferax sp.]